MTRYLDIRAVRIQRYLARGGALWARRGASAAIVDGLSVKRLLAAAPSGVSANDEAPDVDGVASLRLADGVEPDAVIRSLLPVIRQALPALQLEAKSVEAQSYVDAYEALSDPAGVVRLLPPRSTVPLASQCQACGLDPGVRTRATPDGDRQLCRDCAVRLEVGLGESRTVREDGLLASTGATQVARGFRDIAVLARGLAGWRGNPNHLATVFADGNAIGVLMSSLKGAARADAQEASTILVDATRKALDKAAADIQAVLDTDVLATIPHLVGGDDVLVTVPAPCALRFTRTFLAAFTTATAPIAHMLPAHVPAPSASAGVVLASQAHPFASTVELADQMLAAAKRLTGGREASVGWVDVTADGDVLPDRPRCWRLTDLENEGDTITAISNAPQSTRNGLQQLLRQSRFERVATQVDVRRHDQIGALSHLLDRPEVIDDVLSLARWWG